MSTIETALQTLPQGLATLNQQEPALMRALDKLSAASRSIAPFADGGSDDLRGVLNEIAPVLRGIGDTQKGSVMSALKTLPFVIFPLDTIPYMYRGDYANVTVTLDLTHQALDQAFLTGTPAAGALAAAAKAQQGKSPGVAASRAGNPLLLPLGEQATPPPAAQAPIGTLPPPPTPRSDKSGSGLIDKAVPGIGG
jgi:phospholipid/cholesterol/gamma-HCH transport system substrate-binding protein